MIRTPAHRKCHYVVLEKPKVEDIGDPLSPDRVYAAIEPGAAGPFDEERITHLVKMDYHPDVTLNTRITTEDGKLLYVKGMQDIEMKHIELWLYCEEVLQP